MKLHHHYLLLHSRYGGEEELETTLSELAAALDCTHRNAVYLVNRMVSLGWIEWSPQRGRGRKSILRFLVLPDEIAVQALFHTLNRKDMQQSIDQLSLHTKASSVQDRLQGWLMTYFGHHTEMRSDKQIDTLRLPIRQPLQTIDPISINLLVESFIASHVFDGLVKRGSSSAEILPGLAHAWEVNAERTEWTFFLRKEVLFHNGKIMTAADVVYTFERLIRSSRRMLYSYVIKQIKTVQALDPLTVRIELQGPNELFLPFLCTSRAVIVPKDLEQVGEAAFGTKPIGTGSFRVTELNDSLCVLEAFTPYFMGRAHLDRVEIIHVPFQREALESADIVSPFHVVHNPTLADQSRTQIHSGTAVRKFITVNSKKSGPLNDPATRAAFLACLRGEASAIQDHGKTSILTPLSLVTILPYQEEAKLLADKLKDCGYTCQVTAVSPEDFKGPVRLDSDLILFSLIRDEDEQLRLFDLYLAISEHIEPHTRIDIEQLLQSITKASDSALRTQLFSRIEALLTSQHQLYILSEKPVQTAYLPSVRGVSFNSQGWVDLRRIWFPPVLAE